MEPNTTLADTDNRASDLDGLSLVPMSLEAQWKQAFIGGTQTVGPHVLRGRIESIDDRKRLFAPFSARNLLGYKSDSPQVTPLCSAMHFIGGFVTTDVQTVASVPMQRMPKRICPVYFDRMPDFDEMEFADAVELQMLTCPSARGNGDMPLGAPIWPIDLTDIGRLKKKIAALREMTHHQVPVGVAIPKGTVNVDVALVAKADVDFVSLIDRSSLGKVNMPQAFEVSDLWVAVSARRAAVAAGHPDLPIFLDVMLRNGYDLVKLAALGISGVILDRFLTPSMEFIEAEERPGTNRFLGDVTGRLDGGVAVQELTKIVRRLSRISREACDALSLCGYASLNELQPGVLIATHEKAHRLTSIPMV